MAATIHKAYVPQEIAFGIDVGMTYSGAAYRFLTANGYPELGDVRTSKLHGVAKFPSQVFIHQDGSTTPAIGKNAIQEEIMRTGGKLYSLFKRLMGTTWTDQATGSRVSARSLTSLILRAIKTDIDDFLKQKNFQAVPCKYAFSYPGIWVRNTTHDFRQAILEAGFPEESISLIEEPIASALSASQIFTDQNILSAGNKVLVCDLGGGTFDLALIEVMLNGAIIMTAPVEGQPYLGMSNIDKALAFLVLKKGGLPINPAIEKAIQERTILGHVLDDIWNRYQDLTDAEKNDVLRRCEATKITICDHWDEMNNFPFTFENGSPIALPKADVQPIFGAMNQVVRQTVERYLDELRTKQHIAPEAISYVVVSGGGMALPGIVHELQRLLPALPLELPMERAAKLVQQGAAFYALYPNSVTERKCSASFGVKTFVATPPAWLHPEVVPVKIEGESVPYYAIYQRYLNRGDPIQKIVEHEFTPVEENQQQVNFVVLQGESDIPAENQILGTVVLELDPQTPRNEPLRCIFTIEDDGLIHVTAHNWRTGRTSHDNVSFSWYIKDSAL